MAIRKSSSSGIPFGNTAGRPASPSSGQPYFNGETARLELMTSSGSWENIVQEVPGVSSIGGQYLETNNSNTITIYGTNFVSGASAYAVGTNAVEVAATSTTFNSLVQVTAVFTGLTAANEPYDIKVVNPSNLFGILPDSLFVNNQVTWTTSAGSLGSFGDAVAISVSAIAADESAITYAVASGSSLPSGITLNTATGLISGTLPDVASNTTYTFTLTASDGLNPAVSRQFSFTSNAAPVWVTSAGSLGSFLNNTSITTSALSVTDSDTVSYALASGSSLPSGLTLNSSTGVISGTLPVVATNTTYTFTINTLDGVNIIPRTFSITSLYDIPVEILVVAGGGGGGGRAGGGGGAGGLIYSNSTNLSRNSTYLITVGTGGAGGLGGGAPGSQGETNGSNGTNSILGSYTAIGGGGGARGETVPGNNGGSGGGSGYGGARGVATSGQGFDGGLSQMTGTYAYKQGGGGGAGGIGGDGLANGKIGDGGIGLQYSITGTAQFYAAGGGGGGHEPINSSLANNGQGIGGSGVGGNGGFPSGSDAAGTQGVDGTGSGGGGTWSNGGGSYDAARGGNGVVVIAYSNTFPAITTIPGTLTYDQPTRSGYRVYRFTAGSGTITF
jgi:hypothetical protein